MSERQHLGEILLGYGRISRDDADRELAYQRERGGYFGEALVSLGIITAAELEFGLAAQYDLPYVFPDSDAIDREAAELVSPEWALANLTLPISRTSDTLTAVVGSPQKAEVVETLEKRTGLKVQLAMASPAKIRELIREVFDRGEGRGEDATLQSTIELEAFIDQALAEGAERIGISARGRYAVGWWASTGTIHRRKLAAGWSAALERRLVPGVPRDEAPARDERWDARILWEGTDVPVQARTLRTAGGEEILLEPVAAGPQAEGDLAPPPASVISEVRLLCRSGAGRFAVRTEPPELASSLLPELPSLLMGSGVRSLHLVSGEPSSEAFVLRAPEDAEARRTFLRDLRAYQLEALTVDLPEAAETWADDAVAVAATVFFPLRHPGDREALLEAGVGWELDVRREEGSRLAWSLRPLNG
jgi:hypothetical protein